MLTRLVSYDFIAVALVSITLSVMHGIEDFSAIAPVFFQGVINFWQFNTRFYCFKSTSAGPAIHAGL